MNCPKCGGVDIAMILFGYPDMEEIEDRLKKKEIVLGGCCITDHDPKWECNDCDHQWGKQ